MKTFGAAGRARAGTAMTLILGMGGAMALRLIEAGYRLVVCDPDAARLSPLTARGAVAAATPREVADQA